jgi:hypothetical protein
VFAKGTAAAIITPLRLGGGTSVVACW